MRRESAEEVAAAARRRLELLGRELAVEGFGPEDETTQGQDPAVDLDFGPVAAPGRHSRRRPVPRTDRGMAWLQDRLPAALRGRVSLGAGHVAVLAVVVATALAVTAYLTIRGRPTVSPVPRADTMAPSAAAAPASLVTPSITVVTKSTGGPAAAGGSVVVDVAGKVRRPGVRTLPAGSRVVDALREAGGARRGVDLSTLNLARVLVDGEQILVGARAAPGVAAAASSAPGAASPGALVNLNTATPGELEALPGVGPVTAQKIVDWRAAHGAFTAIDELLEIDGIGEKTLAELAPHLTL